MAITVTNIQHNHRGVYGEFTGDGTTTAIPIALTSQYSQSLTGTASVITAPTS